MRYVCSVRLWIAGKSVRLFLIFFFITTCILRVANTHFSETLFARLLRSVHNTKAEICTCNQQSCEFNAFPCFFLLLCMVNTESPEIFFLLFTMQLRNLVLHTNAHLRSWGIRTRDFSVLMLFFWSKLALMPIVRFKWVSRNRWLYDAIITLKVKLNFNVVMEFVLNIVFFKGVNDGDQK